MTTKELHHLTDPKDCDLKAGRESELKDFESRISKCKFEKIEDAEFGGERPLFGMRNLLLDNVKIHAGESSLKRCEFIKATNCTFDGKYPFWHSKDFIIEDCIFHAGARAAIWYSKGCKMERCQVDAPKMFRKMNGIIIKHSNFSDGQEMLWDCVDVSIEDVKINNCDYIFSHTDNIDISDYEQHGNYSFQYCKKVAIKRAKIYSKDAFWNIENVTIEDSELHGEYLGWYSNGLTLINCYISGTQPLCYAQNLTLINCTFDKDCDLCFEESELNAQIRGEITSVKNPWRGLIKADSIGEIIVDAFAVHDSETTIISGR